MARGGKRDGAGRKAGVPNKVTGQNRETLTALAQSYELEAIETLVAIMRDPKAAPAARATCSNSVLDRARGKVMASVEHTGKDGAALFDSELNHRDLARAIFAVLREANIEDSTHDVHQNPLTH